MNRQAQIIGEIRKGLDSLSSDLKGYRVVLFGSRAAGTAKERSDFDVGVLGNKSIPIKIFFKLQEIMDGMNALHKIDLVDLNAVSDSFRDEAMKYTEVLYE